MTTASNENLPVQEQSVSDKTKVNISKTAFVLLSLFTLALIVVPSAVLGKLYKDEKDKNSKGENSSSSSLSLDEDGSDAQQQLPHAMTTWWVLFNHPEKCIQNPAAASIKCGPLDVFGSTFLESQQAGSPDLASIQVNSDAGVAMLYATGGVTNEKGELRMQASIYKSSTDELLDLPYAMDPMELGVTLTNPDAAEVHLIVRDHGMSVGDISQTLADSDDYCDDPPFLWFGSKQNETGNICTDFQTVAFAASENGIQKLSFIATGEQSKESEAHLYRRGDGLQVVILTNAFE